MYEFVYQPQDLTYHEFMRVSNACFENEPVSEREFSSMKASDFWGVFAGEALVGFGFLKFQDDLAWIAKVAVAEAHRRQGIGRRLMELMIERAREEGKNQCILYVEQDNNGAIELYRSFGFSPAETTYQFVVPAARLVLRPEGIPTVTAKMVTEIDEHELPEFKMQWMNLPESHNPPRTYVLVFFNADGHQVGYCRLSPQFPGSFPFVIEEPSKYLLPALLSIRPLLEKDTLRLTFTGGDIAKACGELGYELNYTLYKMEAAL